MNGKPASRNDLDALLSGMDHTIDLILQDRSVRTRRKHLAKLKTDMAALSAACDSVLRHTQPSPVILLRTFTRTELAQYDGRSGNPAYVAVNGVVYDVTNNAAWAAATHFGLSAGNDLTNQYSSCHAGQQLLQSLAVVGSLVDG